MGRARVFNLERSALSKLKAALEGVGIEDATTFFEAPQRDLKDAMAAVPRTPGKAQCPPSPFSPNHGWIRVDRIASLNGGSEEIEDVARGYSLLKERQRELMRPPVFIRQDKRLDEPFSIEAAAHQPNGLMLRLWPKRTSVSRSVVAFSSMHATALVESVFDEDDAGPFDVPILLCAILAPRRPTSNL